MSCIHYNNYILPQHFSWFVQMPVTLYSSLTVFLSSLSISSLKIFSFILFDKGRRLKYFTFLWWHYMCWTVYFGDGNCGTLEMFSYSTARILPNGHQAPIFDVEDLNWIYHHHWVGQKQSWCVHFAWQLIQTDFELFQWGFWMHIPRQTREPLG